MRLWVVFGGQDGRSHVGLVFGPGGPEGPEGLFQPLGLDVSVLCQDCGCEYCFVRLWVVLVAGLDVGLVFGPGGPEGPEGPFQHLGLDASVPCHDWSCE